MFVSVFGQKSFFHTFLEKCLNNDRCVNAFSISSTDISIKQKYFSRQPKSFERKIDFKTICRNECLIHWNKLRFYEIFSMISNLYDYSLRKMNMPKLSKSFQSNLWNKLQPVILKHFFQIWRQLSKYLLSFHAFWCWNLKSRAIQTGLSLEW